MENVRSTFFTNERNYDRKHQKNLNMLKILVVPANRSTFLGFLGSPMLYVITNNGGGAQSYP